VRYLCGGNGAYPLEINSPADRKVVIAGISMTESNCEIVGLFPSVKSGAVECGLWRIPLFFDKSFKKNRGCIRLRRYIVHMAEIGATKEAMMDKTNEIYKEFLALIDKYPADEKTLEKRKHQLDKYMM
jgi:hypothetical protein